jgi:hypothetical protein
MQWNSYSTGQGAHYYITYFYLHAAPASDYDAFRWLNSSNAKVVVRIRSTRVLQLFNFEDSVQIGSDSAAITLDTWYRLELKIDSTTLASTVVEAQLYAASDENTLLWNPSGTQNLAADPNRYSIGSGGADASFDMVCTDIAICEGDATPPNSWFGQGSIVYLRPNGDSSVQWARGGVDSGSNSGQVDDVTPSSADYVESNTSGQVDDYTVSDTPAAILSNDQIPWIVPACAFFLSSTLGGDPDCVVRATVNGNLSESGNISGAGNTSIASYQTTPALVPPLVITTAGMTKAMLDSMLLGVRETASDTHFIRILGMWVIVWHTPGVATKAPPPFQKHTHYRWPRRSA